MKVLYERPDTLQECPTHYCAGCGHGILHRLIAEVIDELGIRGKTIGLAPVGCAVLAHQYLAVDMCEPAHGRTAAVATGIKRALPDRVVFSYQGDGDLAAIGLAETVHAANRGEAISVFFINNAVYGMTGGQMAPTTLLQQKTTTTPKGRDAGCHGHPIRVCEMLDTLDAPAYIERIALASPADVIKARRAIRKSFLIQMEHGAYSLVEFLSACPTHWRMSPSQSIQYVAEEMARVFPARVFRDRTAEQAAEGRPHRA